jgi:predicted PurR-regulated permease PerM
LIPAGTWPHRPYRTISLGTLALTIACLYFGRGVLVPFALALLLAFLLAPLCRRLELWRLGRPLSALLIVCAFLAVVGAVCWAVSSQFLDLMNELPAYQSNVHEKIESLRRHKNGNLASAAATVQKLGNEVASISEPDDKSQSQSARTKLENREPLPVVIQTPAQGLQRLEELLGPLFEPLAMFVIVAVLVFFLLLRREDLRNRVVRLAGQDRVTVTTQALDVAEERISSYLATQLAVNALYGLSFGAGLFLLGIPKALLWGILAGVLRFVPYLGTVVAAVGPVLLSLGVYSGWSKALWTLAFYVLLEIGVAYFLEPLLYGKKTGLSALVILLAAIFWTALWGPVGLLLSTPLMVCLMVAAEFTPDLEFMRVLLGNEEPLTPEVQLYQRLFAMDQGEARLLVEAARKEKSQQEVYDSLLIPALALAELDRQRGMIDEQREAFILHHAGELIDEVDETESEGKQTSGLQDDEGRVACLPARDEADRLVGNMLALVLRRQGVNATCPEAGTLTGEVLQELSRQASPVICVSALPPLALPRVRALYKRLRTSVPNAKVVIGLWGDTSGAETLRRILQASDRVVLTLTEAVPPIKEIASFTPAPSTETTEVHESHSPGD